MEQENIPVQSVKSLINACIVAVLLALVILFVAVLPAEYGIDPTGLGRKMGLTTLSGLGQKTVRPNVENSIATQQDEPGNQVDTAVANQSNDIRPLDTNKNIQWKDTVKIVIPPNKGLEYKFSLQKGAELEYSWLTDGPSIYFDFHGEPKGAKEGEFKSYLKVMDKESTGILTAPFEGIHGWYWENDTHKPITVQLNTNGAYQIVGVIK